MPKYVKLNGQLFNTKKILSAKKMPVMSFFFNKFTGRYCLYVDCIINRYDGTKMGAGVNLVKYTDTRTYELEYPDEPTCDKDFVVVQEILNKNNRS
jgi:hypothetical protein